uniref:Nudix hydrolase 20, chloroplastic-like n=1 Tax=Petromyzon marinus TaxID=7757 RepID=A0AAJ7UDY9_PETMA|nr:nudix hydrolase 20, chloroplastic-like [Petromyzon marinus]
MAARRAERLLGLVRSLDSFHSDGSCKAQCLPLLVDGQNVGLVSPAVLAQVKNHPDVFHVLPASGGAGLGGGGGGAGGGGRRDCGLAGDGEERVVLSPALGSYERRSEAVDVVLRQWRALKLFGTLGGWRDEMYQVSASFCDKPVMKMERSATCLFGVKQYGVHMNGYTHHPSHGLCLWIGRRSESKQTYPGKLDNMAAGGLAVGVGIKETLVKEAAEEAGIPACLAERAVPVGTVSYTHENERGIFPECQFVYDLEIPDGFTPHAADGEMQDFYLWPVDKVLEELASGDFKPNCALVTLDFLIRHGLVDPETEPYYHCYVEGIHRTI